MSAPAESDKVLFAVDNSGSTGNEGGYWDYALRVYEALAAEHGAEAVQVQLWNTESRAVSGDDFRRTATMRTADGGTEPLCLAKASKDFNGHLVLVTDGQVPPDHVDKADAEMVPHHGFQRVTVHLVHTNGEVNRSVSCPFTRRCAHTVRYVDASVPSTPTTEEASVSAEDIALLQSLDTIQDPAAFAEAYPALERAFVARTMGSAGDAGLRQKVLDLSRTLTRYIATHAAKGEGDALYADIVRGDVAAAEGRARTIVTLATGAGGSGIHKQVAFLLRCTEGALRRAFSEAEIASQRAVAAPSAPPPSVAASDAAAPSGLDAATATTAAPFTCPITLDTDEAGAHNVVLLIKAGPPLLVGVDKALVDALLDCPLALTSREDMAPLRAALLSRMDHAISTEAARTLLSESDPRSPMTREAVLRGGLCLGGAADHASATDATLFALFTGGKRLGNPDLWYAAVLFVLTGGGEETTAKPWLEPIHAALTAHLRWRLAHSTSFASLSGLANSVTTKMPLGAALWFCYGGAAAHNDVAPRQEALRAHMGHVTALQWLVQHVGGYPVSPLNKAHVARLRVLLQLLRDCKRGRPLWIATSMELRGLVQRTVPVTQSQVHPTLRNNERGGDLKHLRRVPLDGPADPAVADAIHEALPTVLRSVSRAQLLGLAALVDPSKAAGDVGVPSNWRPRDVLTVPPPLWDTSSCEHAGSPPSLHICPATMRPLYAVREDVTWRDEARRHFGAEPEKLLSTAKLYMECLTRIGEAPSPSSLLLFLYSRVLGRHREKAALPAHTLAYIAEDVELFTEAMEGLSPAEAAHRYKASLRIVDRIVMEKQV